MCDVCYHDGNHYSKCIRPILVEDVRCNNHLVCFYPLCLFLWLFSPISCSEIWRHQSIYTSPFVINVVRYTSQHDCFRLHSLSLLLYSTSSSAGMILMTGFFYKSMLLLSSIIRHYLITWRLGSIVSYCSLVYFYVSMC